MHARIRRCMVVLLAIVLVGIIHATAQIQTGGILYVDDDAPPGGDGVGWNSAFRYLQDALSTARQRTDFTEIRVARGSYKPDQGARLIAGDVTLSFDLVNR